MASRGHILVVEDERAIRRMIRMYLTEAGYTVAEAEDGAVALQQVRQGGIDLILLDVMLPEVDGLEVCRRIRESNGYVPIIMVTAMDDEASRVAGLEIGADDYVAKPFSPRELLARIRAVLRRVSEPETDAENVDAGRVTLERSSRRCLLDGSEVELTRLEFDLLAELASNPKTVHTRERLLERVWGYHNPIGGKTVDVHVANIRKKLGGWGGIVAVRGVGYKLDPDAAAA
jgi:DNA-binding response OmpR family regulator